MDRVYVTNIASDMDVCSNRISAFTVFGRLLVSNSCQKNYFDILIRCQLT